MNKQDLGQNGGQENCKGSISKSRAYDDCRVVENEGSHFHVGVKDPGHQRGWCDYQKRYEVLNKPELQETSWTVRGYQAFVKNTIEGDP